MTEQQIKRLEDEALTELYADWTAKAEAAGIIKAQDDRAEDCGGF